MYTFARGRSFLILVKSDRAWFAITTWKTTFLVVVETSRAWFAIRETELITVFSDGATLASAWCGAILIFPQLTISATSDGSNSRGCLAVSTCLALGMRVDTKCARIAWLKAEASNWIAARFGGWFWIIGKVTGGGILPPAPFSSFTSWASRTKVRAGASQRRGNTAARGLLWLKLVSIVSLRIRIVE